MFVAARCTFLLASALLVAATPPASASVITPTNLFSPPTEAWRYTVAMGGEVSTLTIGADPADASRFIVSEVGAPVAWVTPSPTAEGPDPCRAVAGGAVSCKATAFSAIAVTNSGGSYSPLARDVVIVRGTAHNDPVSMHAQVPVSVTATTTLMEFWSGDAGGTFTGSDVTVGGLGNPADIWHAGPGTACVVPCDLRGGGDRFEGGSGSDRVTGGVGDDVLIGGPGDDILSGGADDDLISPGANKDSVSGGPGTDTVSFDDAARPAGIVATLGGGPIGLVPYDDAIAPATGTGDTYDADVERLRGTPHADRLTGGPGADGLYGAGGDDVLVASGGEDLLDGEGGTDTVDYGARAADRPVTVMLANQRGGTVPEDGAGGDLLMNLESVIGGAGDDVLSGDEAGNALYGGPGSDTLRGNGGPDSLTGGDGVDAFFGGDGDDAFYARDGAAESIVCGPGLATLDIDTFDVTSTCPTAAADPPGSGAPGPGPGSPDPGSAAPPASTGPSTSAPPATLPIVSVTTKLTTSKLRNGRTRIRTLQVGGLRPGDVVGLSCMGKGCVKRATPKPSVVKRAGLLSLTKAVQRLELRAGAVLSVRVTRAGSIGSVSTFTMVRKRSPQRAVLCLPPGAAAPRAC